MPRCLSDKRKKGIIAERVQGRSLRDIASEYGIAASTVKRICDSNPDTVQLATQKKEENTSDILAHMEERRDKVCGIMDLYLEELQSEEKIKKARLSELTTALGTLIDKFTAIGGGLGDAIKEDELSKSLKEMAERLESDAQ